MPEPILIRALRREPVPRTPVWLMRQAGRYLPEYRETRARAGSFMTLCSTPDLACEVTMQPLARFDLDAAILFSDILTIPDAMGLGLGFTEGEGPRFAAPVRSEADVARLGAPDPNGELRYVMDAVRTIRRELDPGLPLIGFAGSPWTLATYMVEGGGSSDFRRIKGLAYDRPDLAERLLDVVTEAVTAYLNAQVEAGADALMIFDTWGGVLTPAGYRTFSLAWLRRIVEQVGGPGRPPIIVFSKGAGAQIEAQAAIGCDALGVDWTTDLGDARERTGGRVALQGNLDPCMLYASPERIRGAVGDVLASYGHGSGHVFNLGHGLQPHMDPEHVRACIDAVHELSPAYHG